MRVALLTNILTPYRVPVYRTLSEVSGVQLRVFTNAATEFDRSWQVDARELDVEQVHSLSLVRRTAFGDRGANHLSTTYVPVGLFGALRRFAPDVVISSELGARTAIALVYAKLFGVPLIIWSYHSRVSGASTHPIVAAIRRILLANCDGVIGMGQQARDVLNRLGVEHERIFDAPNAHDSVGIAAARISAQPDDLREHLHDRGCRKNVALVVGRLIHAKGISCLLDAWDQLPAGIRSTWTLLFVGDGPLASALETRAANREPGELLRVGAVSAEAIVEYYELASVLLFPSLGDPWGLVVNEAMACGTPVLCSSRAGCSDDLIVPGRNGWVFDPTSPNDFREALESALSHPDLASMGAFARMTASHFGTHTMVDGITAAIRSVVERRPPKPTVARGAR